MFKISNNYFFNCGFSTKLTCAFLINFFSIWRLIEDFYQQNQFVLNLTHAMFSKEWKKEKTKKIKRVKDIIKHKGCKYLAGKKDA